MPWDERATSFLKSWTGILTAITALAAAIAGIVTAVSKFGGGVGRPAADTRAGSGNGSGAGNDHH